MYKTGQRIALKIIYDGMPINMIRAHLRVCDRRGNDELTQGRRSEFERILKIEMEAQHAKNN